MMAYAISPKFPDRPRNVYNDVLYRNIIAGGNQSYPDFAGKNT
jgi:hypothetical protein